MSEITFDTYPHLNGIIRVKLDSEGQPVPEIELRPEYLGTRPVVTFDMEANEPIPDIGHIRWIRDNIYGWMP